MSSSTTVVPAAADRPTHRLDAIAPPRHLAIVGGLDAGRAVGLPPHHATIVLGRDVPLALPAEHAVPIDHATVSRRHASLDVTRDGLRVTDLGSRNGTHVGGQRVHPSTSLAEGAVIRLGAVAVEVRDGPAPLPRRLPSPTHGSSPPRPFNRPPRSAPPASPPPPPELPLDDPPRTTSGGLSIAMVLGPVAFGAVLAVLFSPLMAVFALMGPALMIGSWLERRWHDRRQRSRSAGVVRLSVDAFERELRARHTAEQVRRRSAHPDPATLRRWADGGGRLWERRAAHDDAFEVTLGLAHQPWSPWSEHQAPAPEGSRHLLTAVGPLPDAPVVAPLGAGRAVGVVGPPAARDAVVRALVGQVATLHGPADVTIRMLTPDPAAAVDGRWSFVARLPHAHDTNRTASGDGGDGDGAPRPLDLVVVPDASAAGLVEPLAGLMRTDPPSQRRAAIVAADTSHQLPSWCTTVVEVVDGDGRAVVRTPASGAVIDHVLATGISTATAESWAAALSRHRDPEVGSGSGGLPDRVTTIELVGPITPAALAERWRRSRNTPAEVRAPLGAAPRRGAPTEPFAIDLVADGPHLLIGGTTGSGKSELLRTLVLSLALHHPPDTVSFLLVDYKGGSAFDACADLPHTVGLVTDLDHHLAGRALVSLDAEIRRREQLLRQAGVADLTTGAVPSLARLVVVIDEFATLAAELPGFLDALVDVAQRGRSLGVHLVLATQRPHGAVNDRIRTNTNLRIALRMLDRAESSDVIDDPAAARVPRDRPGRGFARLGHDELLPFQAALTEPTALRSLVDRIAEAAACTGTAPPRAPWLPPLPPTVALDDLDHLDHLDHLDQPGSDQDGGDDDETGPALAVTIALADEPARQRRRPWAWAPDQGNLLVYGMPGSGTTTALITVALAFTRRHAPADGHLYAVADGSGGLGVVAGLPHVGAVVDADDGRRQARLVRMLADELDRRRGTGRASRPAVVVLIDDLPGLLRRFDTLSGHHVVDDLHRVFRDGPAVAIHLVATADRPGTIPVALAARTTERLVLRLADPFDLTALGLRPRGEHAPGSEPHRPPPGRGVVGQGPGIEVQVAREPDPSAAVRTISQRHAPDPDDVDVDVDRIDRLMTHRPWTVGELPGRVDVARLPPARVRDGDGGRRALVLPLGIGDRDLQPRGLELHDGDHALIVGPARSGRSTALCVLARSIVGPTGRPRAPSVHATVIALTPRPSPLRDCSGVVAVPDVDRLLSALARAGDADDTLVLIDDADQVADPVGAMAALSTSTRAGLHIVAAGRTDRLRTTYGHWTSWLRSSGHGLVLRPDVDRDGDLWGIRLPRDAESRRNDGRGHLLTDGEVELIQVATPDRS